MAFRDLGDKKNQGPIEREKKSWREIDAMKDQSAHRSSKEDRARPNSAKAAAGYNRYKSELEAMFNKGSISDNLKAKMGDKLKAITEEEGSSAKAQLLRKINNSPGLKERNVALKEFLKAGFTLPDHLDLLTNVIDYHDEKVIREALEKIENLLESQEMSRKASFIERLKLLIQIADEDATITIATRLIEKLRT